MCLRVPLRGSARGPPPCRGIFGLSTGHSALDEAKRTFSSNFPVFAHPTPTPSARIDGLVVGTPAHEYPAPRSPSTKLVTERPGSICAASIQNEPPPRVVAT